MIGWARFQILESAFSFLTQKHVGQAIDGEGADPGNCRLPEYQSKSVDATHLTLHGGYRGHTGCVEQTEHQQGKGRCGHKCAVNGGCGAKEDSQRGHHTFLGHKAADD